jgi:uncharacterized protein (TIGR02246 family)
MAFFADFRIYPDNNVALMLGTDGWGMRDTCELSSVACLVLPEAKNAGRILAEGLTKRNQDPLERHGVTHMRLQILMVGTVLVLCAADTPSDTAKDVEQSVRTIQTAFNKGDVDTVKGLMTEDHMTTLTYARFSSAADQLKVLSDFKFSEYKIDRLKVKALTADVALVSYQADITGTYKGKDVPSPEQVVEVWVKRDGKWLQASYQETPLDTR